jgi:hypothetical protein
MNLPFGLPVIKDTAIRRRDDQTEATASYERKLAKYRDTLENYKRCILEYSDKLDGFDRRSMEHQLSIVQTALDLTYIKEQGDKSIELLEDMKTGQISKTLASLESLTAAMVNTNYQLEGMDKNVVNRLSELLLELQKQSNYQNKQLQTELLDDIERLKKSVKKGHALLWFVLVFNVLGLSALAFLVLYIMEIIPF